MLKNSLRSPALKETIGLYAFSVIGCDLEQTRTEFSIAPGNTLTDFYENIISAGIAQQDCKLKTSVTKLMRRGIG